MSLNTCEIHYIPLTIFSESSSPTLISSTLFAGVIGTGITIEDKSSLPDFKRIGILREKELVSLSLFRIYLCLQNDRNCIIEHIEFTLETEKKYNLCDILNV